MAAKKKKEKTEESGSQFILRLYLAGQTPRSLAALKNLRQICKEHGNGEYKIEIIDLIKRPELAKTDEIIAIPTLVRRLPPPIRKIIGDLSNSERVIVGLEMSKDGQRGR